MMFTTDPWSRPSWQSPENHDLIMPSPVHTPFIRRSTSLKPLRDAASRMQSSLTRRCTWHKIKTGSTALWTSFLAVSNNGTIASGTYVTSVPITTSNSRWLIPEISSSLPHSNFLTTIFSSKLGGRFSARFWRRRFRDCGSPSVGTTRLAKRAAAMEQMPEDPQPSSSTLFPATMEGLLSRILLMRRADSQINRPVDLHVCWCSLLSPLIFRTRSPSLMISASCAHNQGFGKQGF